MKMRLGLSIVFGAYFLAVSSCSEKEERQAVLDFGGCNQIIYAEQPENLIMPQGHIRDLCADYRDLLLRDFGRVWDGWGDAPADFLVIDQDFEFLFTTGSMPDGFAETGYTQLFARPRVFDPSLKATFPVYSNIPVIVIGAPTAEDIETKAWTSTLWHEHFHQFQMSQPGYFAAVNDLGLSGGDTTGMWMLNYPFPYDDEAVSTAFHEMALSLLAAYHSIGMDSFDESILQYLATRRVFQNLVGPENFKYFDFQIWQEGLARYTELVAFRTLIPEAELRGDEYPFQRLENALVNLKREELLRENQRVAFYDFGLVEGLVLDAASPGWKSAYLHANFQIEPLYGN